MSGAAISEDISSDSWCTSKNDARMLGSFGTDPCSNPRSHIRATHKLSLENGDDGLTAKWWGSVFANMPYSNVQPWADRLVAYDDNAWVALVKLDPSTRWYATLMRACTGWAPYRKRLKFERPEKKPMTANFPSALVWSRWWPSAELASHLWLQRYA